jgi:hypothetical protein
VAGLLMSCALRIRRRLLPSAPIQSLVRREHRIVWVSLSPGHTLDREFPRTVGFVTVRVIGEMTRYHRVSRSPTSLALGLVGVLLRALVHISVIPRHLIAFLTLVVVVATSATCSGATAAPLATSVTV